MRRILFSQQETYKNRFLLNMYKDRNNLIYRCIFRLTGRNWGRRQKQHHSGEKRLNLGHAKYACEGEIYRMRERAS